MHGLLTGFVHPILGVDHVVAMVSVGLWASQCGARFAAPLTFMTALTVGAAAGMIGLPLPAVEAGIATSVLALGLLIAFSVRLPAAFGLALTACFALFHGHAHGAEIPVHVSTVAYAVGFLTATGMLHASGIALSLALSARQVRVAGAGCALIGAALFVS